MGNSSNNRVTFKIIISYLVLAVLALVVGYLLYAEVRTYFSAESTDKSDNKLLRTSSLLTRLYEAESFSRLALQTKTRENFDIYKQNIDSIYVEIDSLKILTHNDFQHQLLDSVQALLRLKVANSNELSRLKEKNRADNSFDSALQQFNSLEASLGRITPEALAPNIDQLSPKAQQVIRDMAKYLNENIPEEGDQIDSRKLDSILQISRQLLTQAKKKESLSQKSLADKEKEIVSNDLELSQQLRSIIAAIEQEILINSINDNQNKQTLFRRSMRVAGIAAMMGLVIVAIFTFLIYRDFWRVHTYRQKLEKEKKYSESILKSREQLIATVSHDLRTPLNTISGYSELMEHSSLDRKQKKHLAQIKSASLYVEQLVNDLLDFSRLEAGKIHLEKVPFILANLIHETADNLRAVYKEKQGVELQVSVDTPLDSPVLGDPFRIRQIITNLLGNAFKFTEQGEIKVKATVKQQKSNHLQVLIEVTDTGIGIEKSKQDLIFREFTQAEEKTEKKYGGYGLGLTISKKLAGLLGGSLSLKSELGKGSSFYLQLPLELTQKKVEQRDAAEKKTVSENFGLLIVDDDLSMLKLLKELCLQLNIKALIYNDFKEIPEGDELKYRAVLTDIQMPGTDGFEVLASLKEESFAHFRGQPVIAMTGRRDLEEGHYLQQGFSAVLQKPFSKDQLLQVLDKLLKLDLNTADTVNKAEAKKSQSPYYQLDLLQSFLGDNQEVIDDVLITFVRDSRSNLDLLYRAYKEEKLSLVRDTAHRMLPMFRQLRIVDVIPGLEKLEQPGFYKDISEIPPEELKRITGKIEEVLVYMEEQLAQRSRL
ncbi:ATP-binding protein [Zeaxanthinibacter sp. PT1]|uniref:hybrid sensor histidine kinase/response regulator n=1 Tax=Zeaxanthinibacter TaxID=561554 RepID=UPI002348F24B|nr:ATP-binding protein [Zeaxanthinibacter sp. PT1]MDC6351091.1 ATP-binding protein [Zeaxanthinibacter sp. PT1]